LQDGPGTRLAQFRETLGLSQRAFASALGVSHGAVAFIESGQRTPSKALLVAMADRYGLSSDWLMYGAGEMRMHPGPGFAGRIDRIEPPAPGRPGHGDFRFAGQEFTMVRRLGLGAAAASGLVPVAGGEAEALAFSNAWFARQRINPDLAVLVGVQGDGMAPAIPDGALVLVHAAEMRVEAAGVYAFIRAGAALVRRITPLAAAAGGGGRRSAAWVIAADNPAHPAETVAGGELAAIRVVGRVRCVITTLP